MAYLLVAFRSASGGVTVDEAHHAMDELTDRIGAVEGVERTTSSIVLSTKFER